MPPRSEPPRATRRLPALDGSPPALPAVLDRWSERWWAARPRVRLASVVTVVALVLLAGIAHAASSPHGPPVEVLVASETLRPGDRLADAGLRRVSWPRELVPEDAVTEREGTVAALTPSGAVITQAHLGAGGLASGVPEGRVAVTVPLELLPDLAAGHRVDVIGAGHDGEVHRLAAGATVVGTDAEDAWLAVAPEEAVQVSGAAAAARVGVVIHPP
jgi:hypothetical protein